jgi:hypothetical protein
LKISIALAGAQYYVNVVYACPGYSLSSSDCTSITQQWNDAMAAWGAFASTATCAASSGQVTVTIPFAYSLYATFAMGRLNPVRLNTCAATNSAVIPPSYLSALTCPAACLYEQATFGSTSATFINSNFATLSCNCQQASHYI